MYKQKCIGSRGPLMPVVVVLSCALILYSVADALVRGIDGPQWLFICWFIVMVVLSVLIWRYTRVSMEYMWFSGELIMRRSDRLEDYRLVIRREDMDGLRDHGKAIGSCLWGGFARNCCATLRGRVFDCCTLYYHDVDGRSLKLYFQPAKELRQVLTQIIEGNMTEKKHESI